MDIEKRYANYIDPNGVDELQKLEKELGATILAYSTPPKPANLSKDQLQKIEELETKLCVRLVAYNTH